MPTIKLNQMPEPEVGKTPGMKFEKDGKLQGFGDITFVCSGCERILAENMIRNQIGMGMPMHCGTCQTWSLVPPH